MILRLSFVAELEFENASFRREGKTRVPGEKPIGAKERNNNKLNLHMALTPGSELGLIVGGECSHHVTSPAYNYSIVETK